MITQYHRPTSLDEAVRLASEADAVILGGGTVVGPRRFASDTSLVDLQGVGLSGISMAGDRIRLGAMTRLTEVAESPDVPAVLADLARRELPRSLRNSATVGGTVAASDWESQFVAGLLAFGADVSVASASGSADHSLASILSGGLPTGAIITSVSLDPDGTAASDRTARTPGDVPIVAAVARRTTTGALLLALMGVGEQPMVVDPSDLAGIEPPSDFRGSSEYRKHLAVVLSKRVIAEVGGVS